MTVPDQLAYEFGPFRLVPSEHVLLRDGEPVPLRPKVFDLLLYLIERHGHLVSKEELMAAVWPEQFVEEGNLNKNVSMARQALGESTWIETVPKRGYRFVGEVRRVDLRSASTLPAGITRMPVGRIESPRARVTIAAILLAAAAITGAALLLRDRGEAIDSIAVMPFANSSRDVHAEYLSDGITESLIGNLSQLANLKVMSRNSVFRFKGKTIDARHAAKTLGVRSVLVGNVRQFDDRLAIDVELVDGDDGSVLWSRRYVRTPTDVLALQTSVSQDIAENLRLRLTGSEQQRLAKRQTNNGNAYELYLRGRYFWNRNRRTPEDLRRSVDYFERAIEADPHFALAWAALADAYNMDTVYSETPARQSVPKARAAATRALDLDDTLAEAHTALGWIRLTSDRDWEGAERAFQRAIELNPNYARAYNHYGGLLAALGRFDEAIAAKKAGIALDPLSAPFHAATAWILHFAGRYDEAIASSMEALVLEEEFYRAHLYAGCAYEQQRRYEQALSEFEKARAQSPDSAEVLASIGHLHAVAGRTAEAERIVSDLESMSARKHVDGYAMAVAYAGLGRRDEAFASLQAAFETSSIMMIWLGIEPRFEPLRSDARFAELMTKMRLPADDRHAAPRVSGP